MSEDAQGFGPGKGQLLASRRMTPSDTQARLLATKRPSKNGRADASGESQKGAHRPKNIEHYKRLRL